jgi:hypothetical protein
MKASAVEPSSAMEVVTIDESPTVRNEGVMVEGDVAAVPVSSPVVESPTEAGEDPDPKA